MAKEIERKFLINQPKILGYATTSDRIRQGYLSLNKFRTVRIRMVNDTAAWITVKGITDGCARKEYEYRIPEQDGIEMLEMCVGGYVDKTRHLIPFDDLTIEVDEFGGANEGLIVAEIEFEENDLRILMLEDELRKNLPHWIDKEVTDDPKYYNSSLITNPYQLWNK